MCKMCKFLSEVANKTMSYSVRAIILESENLAVTMTKKIDEEENEDFCKDDYFNFENKWSEVSESAIIFHEEFI